jgi:hypothetical protein
VILINFIKMRIFAVIILTCISLLSCLGGGDHDIIAFKINNLRNKLKENTIVELKVYALKLENYAAHGKQVLGGLHDYVHTMPREDLIKYIISVCYKNQELFEEEKFTSIVQAGTEKVFLAVEEPNSAIGKIGGIHDYLFRQPRSTLIRWALTGEAHERKVKGVELLGGLEDYIDTLSDVEIANYVAEKAKNYKDLDSGDKLDSLAKAYSITHEPQPHLLQMGGLHDYIFRKDRKTLIIWALTCEHHDRYERKLNVLGGLHEMVHTMTNEKIAEYVLGVAAVYPVLNNAENLDALAKKYEIKYDFVDTLKFLQ